eukprot:12545521-Prorocentrum_lima.AAC.1
MPERAGAALWAREMIEIAQDEWQYLESAIESQKVPQHERVEECRNALQELKGLLERYVVQQHENW